MSLIDIKSIFSINFDFINLKSNHGIDRFNFNRFHFIAVISVLQYRSRQSWSYMYGSWIYNYLCNQCLSPLTLWVRIPLRRGVPVQNTLCDKVCQWLAAGMWFSPGTLVSSTNKTGRHNITEILLKVALNTITLVIFPVILKRLSVNVYIKFVFVVWSHVIFLVRQNIYYTCL